MNKINIFCFGFGQVAEAFINKIIDRNINFKLGITSRKHTHQNAFGIDTLMEIVTGIKLENDPVYLQKRKKTNRLAEPKTG